MNPALLFGATKLNIDPETTNTISWVAGVFFVAVILGGIGLSVWYFTPIIYSRMKLNKIAKMEASDAIWLDDFESEIHYGHKKKYIVPKSFEYYICKIVFGAPREYHNDIDIFDEVDEAKGTEYKGRGVEQGVRRLNKKFKELGLKDDLFKRSKERTTINAQYQQNIVID
jgi:hypothetical protein